MGPNGEPMARPCNCLQNVLLKTKKNLFIANSRSLVKLSWSRFETHCFFPNNILKQIFMVLSSVVNNEVTSRFARKQSKFCWRNPLAKSEEFLTLCSLEVKS